MEQILIRTVSLNDVNDIQKHCFVRNTLEEVEKRISENIEKQNNGSIIQYVAEVDGHVVGTMTLGKENHPLYAHRCGLGDVVVGGEYQGKGIARKIFEQCVDYCRNNGIKIITDSVRGGEPAEQVYHKLGFIEYGRLKGGIVESWNDNKEYDHVFLCYIV